MKDWKTTLGGLLLALGAMMMASPDDTSKSIASILLGAGGLLLGTFAMDKKGFGKFPFRFPILVGLLCLAGTLGCTVETQAYDPLSVDNWRVQAQRYIEDIFYAAFPNTLDAPRILTADEFPVGSLVYEDYLASLDGYEVFMGYESAKRPENVNTTDE